MAEKFSLKASQRPESQELYFISDDNYDRFLQERISENVEPGPMLDVKGNVVGQHKGIQFYTIEQRKGLGSFGKPMYVVKINKITYFWCRIGIFLLINSYGLLISHTQSSSALIQYPSPGFIFSTTLGIPGIYMDQPSSQS